MDFSNVFLFMTEPVFGVFDHVQEKPGCTTTQGVKSRPVSDSGGRRIVLNKTLTTHLFCHVLAHLSQRLIGNLLVWSGVRPSIRPSFTMLRHFLLRNSVANQSQILYGASLGRGKKVCSRQLGHMTKMALRPIYGNKSSKKHSSSKPVDRFPRNLVCSIGDSCAS